MQVRQSRWIGLAVACLLAMPLGAFAAKQYQVTGTVLKVTDKVIVVQKANDEKWEIERTADTKVEGTLKVGSKVTISYHMIADSAENKDK